jgi:hypothetical protein
LPDVVLAIALRNTEEGISSTEIASNTEIISGTIAISFLEVPFCVITPTTGMIIRTTGITHTRTIDIRTTDIMGTTAFAVSRFQSGRRAFSSLARSTIRQPRGTTVKSVPGFLWGGHQSQPIGDETSKVLRV